MPLKKNPVDVVFYACLIQCAGVRKHVYLRRFPVRDDAVDVQLPSELQVLQIRQRVQRGARLRYTFYIHILSHAGEIKNQNVNVHVQRTSPF